MKEFIPNSYTKTSSMIQLRVAELNEKWSYRIIKRYYN